MRNTLYTIVLITAGLLSQNLQAAVVTSTADSGPGTLRQAIVGAAAGETIEFGVSGIIVLTSGELLINKDLVINGPGMTNLLIQRSTAAGTPEFRIFNLDSGIVRISGLSLSNGRQGDGGGINNETTSFLSDCAVLNNSATNRGAGIHNVSSLTISNCVVVGNGVSGPSESRGGGINNEGTLTGVNCVVHSNSVTGATSAFGGGIYNAGTLAITNFSITANTVIAGAGAEAGGGGIFNQGTLEVQTSTLAGNSIRGGSGVVGGAAEGAGLANDGGTATLERSTISGNVATGGASTGGTGGVAQGGGIANSVGTILLENSTVSGNAAQGGTGIAGAGLAQGAGIFNNVGSVALAHSTVTANQGEGVFNAEGDIEIKNTILAANLGVLDLFTAQAVDVHSAGFNLLGTWTISIVPGPNDQLNVSAAGARLGPLQDNGGPTFTHALLCGSPAINAGDNAAAPVTDQRGFPRIINGVIDIGAYEFNNASPSISCPPSTVVCSPSSNGVATISVSVSDPNPDALTVIWTLDGVPIQTNQVPAGGLSTTGRVELTVQLLAGQHIVTASVSDANDCVASCTTTVTMVGRGDLYPIALHESSLAGLRIGSTITDIYNGIQTGNFGWLTWAGSPNEPTLAKSLTPPGNSQTYINPLNRNDHLVSVGDWVQGKPGISNSDKVRSALDLLTQIDITVPVWDRAVGRGNNSRYHVVAFARVRIVSYRLPQQNRITARFLGLVPCD